ncbi:hypothetical protein [Phenylobacterium sp.]|uniref:hypothetical protein n=1 Tax=Phenylobacterium sp. TaxID=1871053 RepID=UPI00356241C6
MDKQASLTLVMFEHEMARVLPLHEGGVREFMVDHETRGKERRQLGFDTEINATPLSAIRPLARLPGVRVHCRINDWGAWTREEVETAIGEGATRIYLPMVSDPGQAEAFVRAVDRRAEAAILIETQSAAASAARYAHLGLDAIYIGLNDLAISRGQSFIFSALGDGTIDQIRRDLPQVQFGFGGITCIDRGAPIPCYLLMSELAALGAQFTFARRSFRKDIVGREIPAELARIAELWTALLERNTETVRRDRADLHALIRTLEAA